MSKLNKDEFFKLRKFIETLKSNEELLTELANKSDSLKKSNIVELLYGENGIVNKCESSYFNEIKTEVIFTDEQVNFVKQIETLYPESKIAELNPATYNWKYVIGNKPELFAQALNRALAYQENLKNRFKNY